MDRTNRYSSGDEKQSKLSKDKNTKCKYYKHKKRSTQINGLSHEWLSRTSDDRPNSMQSGYWPPPQTQKLFPAMSDPAVCGYPVQFGYPFDPVALPIYPVIPATPVTRTFKTLVSYPDVKPRKKRPEAFQSSMQKETHYTSLPPGNGGDSGSDQRRRFSDPGLANAQQSDVSCSSSSTSDNELSYVEQISSLVTENERLTKEINLTREELQNLKLEVNTLLELQHSYPAGAVTEMVKEVESAVGMREEALIVKTQQIVKDLLHDMGFMRTVKLDDEQGPTKEEFNLLKTKLDELTSQRDLLSKQLVKLEILVDNFMQETSTMDVKQSSRISSLEQEAVKIRKQIQEILELQKHGCGLRTKGFVSKVSSSMISEDKDKGEGANILSSLDTCESLSSSIGSGSLHSPLVTMSGPVTDV